jgi:hypothetical protein
MCGDDLPVITPLQDIVGTDAKYQYRLTQIVLAYTICSPK